MPEWETLDDATRSLCSLGSGLLMAVVWREGDIYRGHVCGFEHMYGAVTEATLAEAQVATLRVARALLEDLLWELAEVPR